MYQYLIPRRTTASRSDAQSTYPAASQVSLGAAELLLDLIQAPVDS